MILTPVQIREISGLVKKPVSVGVPLSRYTSFRIGGPADLVVEPKSSDELRSLLCYVSEGKIPYLVLGAGTNVLFLDEGFRGVVIRMSQMGRFEIQENRKEPAKVTVGAGVPLQFVVGGMARLGWKGTEALCGIPGSFGGAIATNAGASGLWIGQLLSQVKMMSIAGQELILERENLEYCYRHMELPPNNVVLEGTLILNRGDPESIQADLEKARTARRRTQPIGRLSAGCVFKNPSEDRPAGAIIDRLGFKGETVGDAQVSDLHANFIINRGRATAAQVMELIERIRAKVKDQEGIDLELELRMVGAPTKA